MAILKPEIVQIPYNIKTFAAVQHMIEKLNQPGYLTGLNPGRMSVQMNVGDKKDFTHLRDKLWITLLKCKAFLPELNCIRKSYPVLTKTRQTKNIDNQH
jgi:hypothetical protein